MHSSYLIGIVLVGTNAVLGSSATSILAKTPLSNTTALRSVATTSSGPQTLATASVALSTTRNSTSAINATTTADATCCFLSANQVGINTWYSTSVEVIVATVVTTWIKYNNTVVPANSTTIHVKNATAFFGTYDYNFTTSSGFPSDIPTTLLPTRASYYGSSIIGKSAVTFPEMNNLVIHSPTPFFSYFAVYIDTSWICPTPTTKTSYTMYIPVDKTDGISFSTTVFPTLTTTELPPDKIPLDDNQHYDVLLQGAIIQAFPDGDYSDFSYDRWVQANGKLGWGEWGGDLLIDPGVTKVASFLAGIPWVKSSVPGIASCTASAWGDGAPTVHIPVNELTATVHTTLSIPGSLKLSNNGGDQTIASKPSTTSSRIISGNGDSSSRPIVAETEMPKIVPISGHTTALETDNIDSTPKVSRSATSSTKAPPDAVTTIVLNGSSGGPSKPTSSPTKNLGDFIASIFSMATETVRTPTSQNTISDISSARVIPETLLSTYTSEQKTYTKSTVIIDHPATMKLGSDAAWTMIEATETIMSLFTSESQIFTTQATMTTSFTARASPITYEVFVPYPSGSKVFTRTALQTSEVILTKQPTYDIADGTLTTQTILSMYTSRSMTFTRAMTVTFEVGGTGSIVSSADTSNNGVSLSHTASSSLYPTYLVNNAQALELPLGIFVSICLGWIVVGYTYM